MINVMVVEDSAVVRAFLIHILATDSDIAVIATACNGEKALEALCSQRPDVILMDIHMPVMNGVETTRRIMETRPIPIVIVSGSTAPADMETTFEAMNAGALAVLRRPAGLGNPDHEATAREMIQTVKLMSEVKTIRRWPHVRQLPVPSSMNAGYVSGSRPGIVAIGASTGGPSALEAILAALPRGFPVPILVVQHMSSGFVEGFVRWLRNSSNLAVHLARHGELPLAGAVYIAPDEYQMKIGNAGRIVLAPDRPEHGSRPSVSYLFRAVAQVYGGNCIAGLLTGMGRDGVKELQMVKERGGVTFAQDKETSVVHGMPGEAIRTGAATLVLPLQKIASVLTNLVDHRGEIKRDG